MQDTKNSVGIILSQIPQPLAIKEMTEAFPLLCQKVPAGFPSPADDYVEESLDINNYLVRHKASTFFFTVQGDSMVGTRIFDGDKVVVDRSIESQHQHIVIAVINNEYTLKRLYKLNNRVELRAENPRYAPICFREGDDVQIWGVVVGVFRRFKV